MFKIKRKFVLVLILSILALAAVGTSVLSEADNVQTEEKPMFNSLMLEFNIFSDGQLAETCIGMCDMP